MLPGVGVEKVSTLNSELAPPRPTILRGKDGGFGGAVKMDLPPRGKERGRGGKGAAVMLLLLEELNEGFAVSGALPREVVNGVRVCAKVRRVGVAGGVMRAALGRWEIRGGDDGRLIGGGRSSSLVADSDCSASTLSRTSECSRPVFAGSDTLTMRGRSQIPGGRFRVERR